MKVSIKNYYEKCRQIFNNEGFKIVYFALVLMNILITCNVPGEYFFDTLIGFTHYKYMYLLLMIVFYSIMITSKVFDTNFESIMRYKDKRNYLKTIMIVNFCVTAVTVAISLMLGIISLIVFHPLTLVNMQLPADALAFFSFLIFYYIRYVIIFSLLNGIVFLVYKNAGLILSLLATAFIEFFLGYNAVSFNIVSSFADIRLFPGIIMLSAVEYDSFSLELCASILMILVLMIINYILYRITIKRKKNNFLISY